VLAFQFRNIFDTVSIKVRNSVRKNWGYPFLAVFMTLLLGAAVHFSVGLSSLADALAVYAYYALVAGVLLQFFCYIRYRKETVNLEANGESS
jgi:hypothetical protein